MFKWHIIVLITVLAPAWARNPFHDPSISYSTQMQSRAVETLTQMDVLEGQPAGMRVGYIPTKPSFTYRFNEPPKEFTLDPQTGEIRTNMVLDREAMRDNHYDLVVLSSQPTYPIEVRIQVIDINDNPPEFPDGEISVAFSESSAPGTRLLLDAATDKDSGLNGVSDNYEIIDGNTNDNFRLVVTPNPTGEASYLHLETTGKLDRESIPSYILNISAQDGGKPPRFGFLQVNVTILDVNDNPPMFDHSDYSVSLNESVPPGTMVLQVTATDSDEGDNARITYYLPDNQQQFIVNPQTGVIQTADVVECPQQNCKNAGRNCSKSCVFTVFARDHGVPRQDGRTYVTVNLFDANDHDPQLQFRYFPPTPGYATVDENASNNTVVAAISVEDVDEGPNGETTVRIVKGNEMNHFRLHSSSSNLHLLRVNGVLDREEINKYNLTVVAMDKGSPARTATAFLIIHVNDVNDHEPVFEKSEYSTVLSELVPSGTYVASITAHDADTGVNAQIYYAFVSGNDLQWFEIDASSGLVRTKGHLDREVLGTCELKISARDGGPNPKWAYTYLKVTILDENDEAPRFSQPYLNVSLPENSNVGTLIAMLTAADRDQGRNGSVTYSIDLQQMFAETFALDPITGQLTTKSKIDREEHANYEIVIVAKDQGSPPRSSSASVFLNVVDVNDNAPEFYPTYYFVSVMDRVSNRAIVNVTARDPDEGMNADITYKIESGDDDGIFNLNAKTGAITLSPAFQLSKPMYKLVVSAQDPENLASENALIEIIKESYIEHLDFDHPIYEFQITEDNADWSARNVGTVRIRNAGRFENKVTYTIVYGDNRHAFKIHDKTGAIQTATRIDRELNASYTLDVVARAGFAYGKTQVNVTVTDVNDNAPYFQRTRDEVDLLENAPVGQEVFYARAMDRDYGINSKLTYDLSYNPDDQFRISTTGVIYLNRPVRQDPGFVFHLEILCKDMGRPSLSSKHPLFITVQDVNDHTPVFDHTSYETSLLESTPVNRRFFALHATDADLNANSRLRYTIESGDDHEKFGIFPDGFLYVKNHLDREERDYFALTIRAEDGGNPPRSSSVPVVIHVIDENDNAPQFTNTTFEFMVKENEPLDTFVGKLTAYDKDIGRNAELFYTLPPAQTDFFIDHRNGFLKTRAIFDREQLVKQTGADFIVVDAIVSDNGRPRLSDKVKVKVIIADVNDHAPEFLRTPYEVQVLESVPVHSQIVRLYSHDLDEGLNGDVYYSMTDGDGTFRIDEATGQISTVKELDRESKDRYVLNVIAYDAGTIRLNSTTIVTVVVLDENDNAPVFDQSQGSISIIESTQVSTELTRFKATDADLGLNADVIYSISSGNRKETFHMDPTTGVLSLHKPLDYEEVTIYHLNITASDVGFNKLHSTIEFIVHVLDANDNEPMFAATNIVRQIREDIPLNSHVVTITAEDRDSGENGKVSYDILTDQPIETFAIDRDTGMIVNVLPIDREVIDTYNLTIRATDHGVVPLSSNKTVTIIVEDVNDNAPIFVSMNAVFIDRATNPIMQVIARDLDSSTNGLVTYDLVSGDENLFTLHRTSGSLMLKHRFALDKYAYQLLIKATDEAVQSERRSTDTYLTLINAGSDGGACERPVFERDVYNGSVFENEHSGTSVLQVGLIAVLGSREVEFYLVNVTDVRGRQCDRLFNIDVKVGVVTTVDQLDREVGADEYWVHVVAVVVGRPGCLAMVKAKIEVLDKNDSPPTFKDTQLTYAISEDLVVGSNVATIRAYDPDTIGTLTYSLRDDDERNRTFTIDEQTGSLTLTDALDREKQSVYYLRVRADDGLQFTDTTLTIQIMDTNDNAPVFNQPTYSFDIPEDSSRGTRVGTIGATDSDEGVNSQLSYSVISDWANDVFSLNTQTGVFTLTAKLDYEEIQHYILVVQAQDNGVPSLSSTLTVYMNVIDLNDNAPTFDPMSYSDEVYENVSISSSVVTVTATDLDSGKNGDISYSIVSGNKSGDFGILANGTIVSRRALDRETTSTYNLVVMAEDGTRWPEKKLSSTVQVTIIVKDINDMQPRFVSANETEVMENIAINSVVMQIKAVDLDEGRNSYLEYSLINDSELEDTFTLGTIDGLLRVARRIDREIRDNYTLEVSVRDRGEPSLANNQTIHLRVLDENDNSPAFDPKQYSASVAENASIGASVLQVSATDVDADLNGRVRFSIQAGDINRDFSIAEDSGVIRVAKNLNYERKSRYVLKVRAEDCAGDLNGEEVRADLAEVVISVTDINDNPPTFLDSPYLAYVMENTIPPQNGYVLTVEAFDADTPPFNSLVRYFIKEGDGDLFRINASTGEISLLRPLDREKQSEYVLSLVAMDTGSPPLTGTGVVRIIVGDINDHAPEFEWDAYESTVDENLPPSTWVLSPKAHDLDYGLNAKIRYSLLGEKSARFVIDPDTGVIRTGVCLDREETDKYQLVLMAQDSSTTDPKATTVNLTILIGDENDNAPVFEQDKFEIVVPDKIRTNQFVFGVKAVDLDYGENSFITYGINDTLSGVSELSRHSTKFTIDRKTGIIRVKDEFSSRDSTYRLFIYATDNGRNRKSARTELIIRTNPSNLFPTFLAPIDNYFTLPENTSINTKITKVMAQSPKPNVSIRYSIAGGNTGQNVVVDSITGDVEISGDGLDYETSAYYEVWIEAIDNDQPPLRSVQQLLINVTDTNDNCPDFEHSIYNATVLEEEPPGVLVTKVRAYDNDSGEMGVVTYKLQSDEFEVTDAGEIFTTTILDRESVDGYTLIVYGIDQGTPALTGSATVLVTVLDKNDNPPKFTRLFSVNVTENAEIGSFVIRVTSSDLDAQDNANATYKFTGPDSNPTKFRIDPISGNVTVAGYLDREQQDEYILRVTAFDGAWAADTHLTITIQDQNDNAPEFEHSYYSFNFPELKGPDILVGQVNATDHDKIGPNSVISYSFNQPNDLFTIDPATGEVFSKQIIRYINSRMPEISPENTYSLTVLATDNGKPPLSSECLVTVNVIDSNNNPPQFDNETPGLSGHSESVRPVPINAKINQNILRVHATDPDCGMNAELRYETYTSKYYPSNATGYFRVNPDGWIILEKPLRDIGAIYTMQVKVTDNGIPSLSDTTNVSLIVTGENKHHPAFTGLIYHVRVPENEPIGSVILTVTASDLDAGVNGIVRYTITDGPFDIDRISGSVTIVKALDFDTQGEYVMNITAIDSGFYPKQSIAQLTVTLTDVNDNPPTFNATLFHVYFPENRPRDEYVTHLLATDIDSPKNAVVEYAIIGGTGRNLFRIDPKSGVIRSMVTFDYEERDLYDLSILAMNPESQMQNSTKLFIHITGVNEYYPKFVQPVFYFDVSESTMIGTQVGSVQATDQDQGEDGRVFYLFVGSSNDRGFRIQPDGVVRVARFLDRETQNRVVLTVIAKNAGSIRGNDTDEAQVIITIQDGNDPPEFLNGLYNASVAENVKIGTPVALVKAIDKDVRPPNNQFTYQILSGNHIDAFKVDPQSGVIETLKTLDRETVPFYDLYLGAIDAGVPSQTGTTVVHVHILDVNDNGPSFENANVTGYVLENQPPFTKIMQLEPMDKDLAPNGGPFTFYLVGGRHREYVSLEMETGVLKTLKAIDRELTPMLDVIVEIEDSGVPKMRARHSLNVVVLDENDSPSSSRKVHVVVVGWTGQSTFPIGKIGDVHPNDPDLVGEYRCRIQPDVDSHIRISNGCDLYISQLLPPDTYSLTIIGNDGRHPDVTSDVSLEFVNIDNATIANAITIRIENISAVNFFSNYYQSLMALWRSNMDSDEIVRIFAAYENGAALELYVVMRRTTYYSKSHVIEHLTKQKFAMKSILGVLKFRIGYLKCSANECANGACKEMINVHEETRIIDTPTLILTTPTIVNEFTCECPDGFAGQLCDKRQDPCTPNPCQNGQCRRQGYEFQCVCPSNKHGRFCEMEKDDPCMGVVCRNGGTCHESSGRTFCLCRAGYRGPNCESVVDSCRPNPCLHGGICQSLKPGYVCSCPDMRYGVHCQKATMGFNDLGYMQFGPLDANTNDISITFSTTKPDALLLYNYGRQSGGRSDFIAIELLNGKAAFSFGGSRTAITRLVVGKSSQTKSGQTSGQLTSGQSDSGSLNDGKWYKITGTRNGKVVSLSVSGCMDNGDTCDNCHPGDSCYADDIGQTGTLNFNNQPLLIGGLPSPDPILERPDQIRTDDFVGCIHSITINGKIQNMSHPLERKDVQDTCNRVNVCTHGNPCGSGQCLDMWNGYMCKCNGIHHPILAGNCDEAFKPVSIYDEPLTFTITPKYRRIQLLDHIYAGTTTWRGQGSTKRSLKVEEVAGRQGPTKSLSLTFRTYKRNGVLIHAATNQHYTHVEIQDGAVIYKSQLTQTVNMSGQLKDPINDNQWHTVELTIWKGGLRMYLDGNQHGDELDTASVHDFLDPYLTHLNLGGGKTLENFEGCLCNFTINNEIQPFTSDPRSLVSVRKGSKIQNGCRSLTIGTAAVQDPLSIGITLVIIFFVVLLVAILVSFVVFRLRKQKKEKSPNKNGSSIGTDNVRNHMETYPETNEFRLMGTELIAKKFKERELTTTELQRSQRPDIIEREVVVGKVGSRDEHHPPIPPPSNHSSNHMHEHDVGSDMPEHYDLENASSIAPSDIDIVYHYKGYREANVRKYKPPPNVSGPYHKHSTQQQQHRHQGANFAPRLPPNIGQISQMANMNMGQMSNMNPTPAPRQHQSTPLARLSPSSELSAQQPRILTLHDISGKPLQTALLATSSSTKEHSNSERSINSPVMGAITQMGNITQLPNTNQLPGASTSSLVSTLDAVSSSTSDAHHVGHMRSGGVQRSVRLEPAGLGLGHSPRPAERHSSGGSTSSDEESGNDSFTCSEIEYENSSVNGDHNDMDPGTGGRDPGGNSGKKNTVPLHHPTYDGFDSSFRGSLSTLAPPSDDELNTGPPMYHRSTGPGNGSPTGGGPPSQLNWDYLLNLESLVGGFKDIGDLPESVNRVSATLRLPSTLKPSEEYV